ncbi:MAG: hypothetical protein IPG96_07540 [Proteobacteria bacterium]|nr:hypothetical protein [Pseudomonadota bacterium]
MQPGAFNCPLKVPLGQAEQLRSAVGVPSLPTYWPALQVVLATQAVAALPSWSQVPSAQGLGGVVLPAQ